MDPFGYKAEWESEHYYLFTLVPKEYIISEITKIRDKIEFETDVLIIKSLLIFAFDIVESYTRAFVMKVIPEEKKNPFNYRNIFQKISSAKDRITLYKKYTDKTLNYIPYYQDIRNSLAHDILNSDINYPEIITFNKNGERVQSNIKDIISELLTYITNPISND